MNSNMVAVNNPSTKTVMYILKAKRKHGGKYNYSLTEWKGSKTKVKIICVEHGTFEQREDDHLRGKGCPKCAWESHRVTFQMGVNEFVRRANEKYKGKFNYSMVEYANLDTKVKIICRIHGTFEQTPNYHLDDDNKCGCPECTKEAMYYDLTNPTDVCKMKIRRIHGNDYSLSQVEYTGINKPVKIFCKKHRKFHTVTPARLYAGYGPECCSEKNRKAIIRK